LLEVDLTGRACETCTNMEPPPFCSCSCAPATEKCWTSRY